MGKEVCVYVVRARWVCACGVVRAKWVCACRLVRARCVHVGR